MSETKKASENTRRATDDAARSGQASAETAGKAARESIGEASQVAQHGADRAKEVGQSMTETVAETAHAAAKAAEQGREVMMMGVRTAAGVGSRVADISFGRGHHMMSSAAHAMDIYHEASERSSERVQALWSSALAMGRGMQSMQHAWMEMLDHSMEHAAHKPQDLLRCKNMVELAEVQRDLYLDAINYAFESTSRLLDLAGQAAQDAVRPLRS